MISQKKIFFILLISATIIIRYLYGIYHPTITIASDTFGYYETGTLLVQDFSGYFINDKRTPIYPLFMVSLLKLKGYENVPISSAEFSDGANLIVLVQQIIGALSLILLFFILRTLKFKESHAAVFTLFMAVNPMLFSWERVLMPETLTIFLLLFITFLFIKGLKTGKSAYFYPLLPLFIIFFLLKPIYILLPVFTLPILAIFKGDPLQHCKGSPYITLILVVFTSFVYLLVPLSYIKINQIRYHYRGINHSSDINLLGKILKYNLPVESAKDVKYFYDNVKDYRTLQKDSMPYRFLEYYDWDIYHKRELLNLLPSFNSKVISNNFFDFATQSVLELPQALTDISELITPPDTTTPLGKFFSVLFNIYKALQYLFFSLIILIPYSFIAFIKKRDFTHAISGFLGSIIFYQIFFSIFFSYGEFGRLINPAQPIMYLFIFMQCQIKSLKFH